MEADGVEIQLIKPLFKVVIRGVNNFWEVPSIIKVFYTKIKEYYPKLLKTTLETGKGCSSAIVMGVDIKVIERSQ
jgi:hypothetical protein